MEILHVAPSPKAGQTEHIANARGQALIDAGFAVLVPMPARGSRDWLAAMQKQEAARVALIPADQRQSVTLQWAVSSNPAALRNKVKVVKTVGSETTFFDAPPKDCPLYVRDKFAIECAKLKQLGADNARIERERQENAQQQQADKEATVGSTFRSPNRVTFL